MKSKIPSKGMNPALVAMSRARDKGEKKEQETVLCDICGKVITGEHVYIQTRRKTKLHIHFGCMDQGGRKTDE